MKRLLPALAVFLLGFGLVAALLPTGAVERLELLTLDARYALGVGRRPPGDDVVVAWIDQESIDYLDENGVPFPWPREVYAQAMAYLFESGARVVVFDVLFDQRGNAEDDRVFAAALQEGGADVLAMKFVEIRSGGRDADETRAFAARGLAVPAAACERPAEGGLVLPLPELAAAADGLGFVNVRPDADKVFRRYDLLRRWGPEGGPELAYPSLALAALLADRPAAALAAAPGGGLALPGGLPPAPADRSARMLLNFRGPEFTFPPVKLVNVLESINRLERGEEPLYPPERFRDKIVLVGIHAEGLEDAHPTPLSDRFPGVELHATALDNLLQGDALAAPRWELPLAAAAALLATVAVFARSGVAVPLATLGALLTSGLGAALLAWSQRVAVPLAAPAVAGAASAGLAFLHRLVVEGRQRRALGRAFRSYLAPEVLREVLRDPDAVRLGGETRELTLLFTDLAGFTDFAERRRPDELVAFLSDYFTRMCRPLLEERGVIDKFIGDSIMAFFGAPIASADHARAAVRAALGALATGDRIAAEAAARGLPPIATRIGVHTGTAVVGNMGSAERFDYTAIGDAVNLAARLEGANKAFGTRCLVSAATWASAGDEFVGREVGRVTVAGRTEPIRVFEPLAPRDGAAPEDLAFAERWAELLRRLRAGERAAARTALAACAELRPGDPLAGVYAARLDEPDFDGSFRLEGK